MVYISVINTQTLQITFLHDGAKLLGMHLTDDLQWKTHIHKTMLALNSRLFLIKRLKNKIGLPSLKRVADSIFNSKLRYGIHLCGMVRTTDLDSRQSVLEDIQKIQNKLFRLLNNTRISDKISTKSIATNLNMLSVNQINAKVKLTEMWKASNVANYPTKLYKKEVTDDNRITRSTIRGDIVIQGKSELCNASFIQDAAKNWNLALLSIKNTTSMSIAKKEIRKFVLNLPI